jgi:hypothetical protein
MSKFLFQQKVEKVVGYLTVSYNNILYIDNKLQNNDISWKSNKIINR